VGTLKNASLSLRLHVKKHENGDKPAAMGQICMFLFIKGVQLVQIKVKRVPPKSAGDRVAKYILAAMESKESADVSSY